MINLKANIKNANELEQVENFVGRIDLLHGQAMLVPGDLRKVEVFARLEDQRFEPRARTDSIGNRLVNGETIFSVKLVEVA